MRVEGRHGFATLREDIVAFHLDCLVEVDPDFMVTLVILHHLAQSDRLVVRQILFLHEYARIGVLPFHSALPHKFDSLRRLLLQFIHAVLKFGLGVHWLFLLNVSLLSKKSLLIEGFTRLLISDDRVRNGAQRARSLRHLVLSAVRLRRAEVRLAAIRQLGGVLVSQRCLMLWRGDQLGSTAYVEEGFEL